MKNQILVIGGSGTVGKELSKVLDDLGEIHTFDRNLENPDFKQIQGDIRNYKQVKEAIKDKNIVIHAAGLTGLSNCKENPLKCFDINTLGTYNVCKALRSEDSSKLVYLSSREVYGNKTGAEENDNFSPRNVYGRSKAAGEQIAKSMCEDSLIIRPSNVFGVENDVVMALTTAALENSALDIYPDVQLDLIYIEDFNNLLKNCIKENLEGTFNLGSGQAFKVRRIAEIIESEFDRSLEKNFHRAEENMTTNFSMSIEKLKSKLDYKIPDQEKRIRQVVTKLSQEHSNTTANI